MSKAQPESGRGSTTEGAMVTKSESWSQPDSDMPRMTGGLGFIVDAGCEKLLSSGSQSHGITS